MTNETKDKPSPITLGTTKFIKIEDIIFEEDANSRMTYEGPDMAELIASIKFHGVLEPILVRPQEEKEKGKYILIAGHRRFVAAQKLGMEMIFVRILFVGENKAREIRAVENVQRKNLNALEEADSLKRMFDIYHDLAAVATSVGKSSIYVNRSISLLDLPDSVRTLIVTGDLSPEHGHQIMRADPKQREHLAKFVSTKNEYTNQYPTVPELKKEIQRKVERDLKNAIFPKDIEYAGKIPCVKCPYNSANQKSLFEGAVDGACTSPECYAKKEAEFYKEFKTKNEKEFEKHFFLGFLKMGYNDAPVLPRRFETACVLPPALLKNRKISAEMKTHPEYFGWCVIKPSRWSKTKKPAIAVLVFNGDNLPDDLKSQLHWGQSINYAKTDYRKIEIMEGAAYKVMMKLAAKVFNKKKPKREHLSQIAAASLVRSANGLKVAQAILGLKYEDLDGGYTLETLRKITLKIKPDELLLISWLCSFEEYNIETEMKFLGIDFKSAVKAAMEEAGAKYDAALKAEAETEKKDFKKDIQ